MAKLDFLQGMKVVDLSTFVAAPVCAKILGEYGAEVIRVEPKIGDSVRYVARQVVGVTNGDNPFYDTVNGNKRQICVDTRRPEGLAVLHRLLEQADVFVCNMRADQAARSGLDWESVHAKYPRIVYANVTGYGTKGPFAGRAGFDNTAFYSRTGLNSTCQSAVIAAADYPGRVFVVDSENVTMGEQLLIRYAVQLRDRGSDAPALVEELERAKRRIRVIAAVDTLEYLKRGGRVSSVTAFAGTLLGIKPVVAVIDGEVEVIGKARGSKKANNMLTELIEQHGGVDFSMPYVLGFTGMSDALLQKYIADSAHLWQEHTDSLPVTAIGSVIGTHVGPGAVGVAFFSKE